MGFFTSKKEISLEDFCHDFYERSIMNPTVGELNILETYTDVIIKNVSEADPSFAQVDRKKLGDIITVLRFELFALAWTHKFVSGKLVLLQSDYTRRYLREKGRSDIWEGMEPFNNMIKSATLHWLQNLGRVNMGFNYNMLKVLEEETDKLAQELGLPNDECVVRVKNRLLSESAWRQKITLSPLTGLFCEQIGVNGHALVGDAPMHLAAAIDGFYQGAQQSWENVKILKK